MNLIRLANEYEEKLKDIALKEVALTNKQHYDPFYINPFYTKLIELGYIPLFIGKNNSAFLGEGGFSKVYRILYKGKPAVAKITKNSMEFTPYFKLFNLKDKLGNLGKHILEIYDLNKFEVNTDFGKELYYVLITEELFPINPHISKSIFGNLDFDNTSSNFLEAYINQFKDKLKLFKSRLDLINLDIIEKYLNNIDLFKKVKYLILEFKFNLNKLINLFDIEINKIELKESDNNYNKFNKLDLELLNKIEYLIEILENEFLELKSNKAQNIILNIKSLFDQKYNRNLQFFPRSYLEYKTEYKNLFINKLPEVKSLMQCLLKLKQMGIKWADLKDNNIMQRRDHTLVISDPGLFREI